MKRICLLLLATVPLILSQDYVVPNLDYDQTAATCDNIDVLISNTQNDRTRIKNYVTVTLPARIDKLNDIYASVQKTCTIIQNPRPSLVQIFSFEAKKRIGLLNNIQMLSKKVEKLGNSVYQTKSEKKAFSNLLQTQATGVNPNDLCNNVYASTKALSNYLNWLIPAITSKYVSGVLVDRINTLNQFKANCNLVDCNQLLNTGDDDLYAYYPALDSQGSDIQQLTGKNVGQLKDWCNANSNCLAFNTEGYVKNALRPKSGWTRDYKFNFYVKKSSKIPNEPTADDDYTYYPSLDSSGGDIKQITGQSVAQLKDWCNANPTCIAFNTEGFVKSSIQPKSGWTRGYKYDFYLKNSATVPSEPVQDDATYTYYPKVDPGAGDLKTVSGQTIIQLKALCSADPSCLGFSSNGILKNSIQAKSAWTRNAATDFYLKKSATVPEDVNPDDGTYTYYPTLDSSGGDIKQITGQTVAQLKAWCNANPTCIAFNTEGFVKSSIQRKSGWTRGYKYDFYVKNTATIPAETTADDDSYTFYPAVDSQGSDIQQFTGKSVNDLKAWCSANPTCVAFNTEGFVKNALRPKGQWTRDYKYDFYTKNSANVPAESNGDDSIYTYYPTLDSQGSDIQQLTGYSVSQLKQWCNNNANCVAFNTEGFVKTAMRPKSQWTRGYKYDFYAKKTSDIPAESAIDDVAYTYYPGIDSAGSDIQRLTGRSVSQLKDWCDANPSCVGFNTEGFVKSALRPKSQWTRGYGYDFYAKNTASIPTEGNADDGSYTFYPSLDSGGNDIRFVGQVGVAVLKSMCDNDGSCLGFNTEGYLKRALQAKTGWTRGYRFDFFMKKSATIPGFLGSDTSSYDYYPTLDSSGGDIRQFSGYNVYQLRAWCDANPTCLAFNTEGFVKSSVQAKSGWTRGYRYDFYLKKSANIPVDSPTTSDDSTYTFYPALDSAGNDIKQVTGQSVAQLKQLCNSDPTCVAFNTEGYIKRALQAKTGWTRGYKFDFYVKKSATIPGQYVGQDDSSYVYYPTLDSAGNDIQLMSGKSASELKTWCNANPTCVGFNTEGYVKNALLPKSQWTRGYKFDFYAKRTTTIPGEPNLKVEGSYTLYPSLDSSGGDIRQITGQTVTQLKAWCDANPTCLAFNTEGFVKSSLRPKSGWTRGYGYDFYVKKSSVVPSEPTQDDAVYTYYPALDSAGNDIRQNGGKSVDELKQLCGTDPTCVSFNTEGFVKNALQTKAGWTRGYKYDFYVKKAVKIPNPPNQDDANYTYYPALDSTGNDIKQITGQTVAQLKAWCDANPTCVAFNTEGYVKSNLLSKNKWTRGYKFDFYVKNTQK